MMLNIYIKEEIIISTTLNLLKKVGAWQGEYELILSRKNGANGDSPIPILEILEFSENSNDNLNNALWGAKEHVGAW